MRGKIDYLISETLLKAGNVREGLPRGTSTKARGAARFLQLVGVVSVSIFVSLLIAEAVVRVSRPHILRTPIYDDMDGLRTLRPNITARLYVPGSYDVQQTINAQRMRDSRAVSLQPDKGRLRIVAMGDSLTFGDGAEDPETYPNDLQRLLASEGVHAEVLNAGVPGTGTGEQALYFEEYVRQFHPDIVILAIYGNDATDDLKAQFFAHTAEGVVPAPGPRRASGEAGPSWLRRLSQTAVYTWLAEHSHLFAVVRNHLLYRVSGRDKQASGDPDLALTEGEIHWLNRRVEAASARLAIVYFPSWYRVYQLHGEPFDQWQTDEERLVRAVQAAAANDSIPFLDSTPAMQQQAASDQGLYFRGLDDHPTPAGYGVLAGEVEKLLRDHALLTEPSRAGGPSVR